MTLAKHFNHSFAFYDAFGKEVCSVVRRMERINTRLPSSVSEDFLICRAIFDALERAVEYRMVHSFKAGDEIYVFLNAFGKEICRAAKKMRSLRVGNPRKVTFNMIVILAMDVAHDHAIYNNMIGLDGSGTVATDEDDLY